MKNLPFIKKDDRFVIVSNKITSKELGITASQMQNIFNNYKTTKCGASGKFFCSEVTLTEEEFEEANKNFKKIKKENQKRKVSNFIFYIKKKTAIIKLLFS